MENKKCAKPPTRVLDGFYYGFPMKSPFSDQGSAPERACAAPWIALKPNAAGANEPGELVAAICFSKFSMEKTNQLPKGPNDQM